MQKDLIDQFVKQIEKIEKMYETLCAKSKYDDLSDLCPEEITGIVSLVISAVNRISGSNSIYSNQLKKDLENRPSTNTLNARIVMGTLKALKEDISSGYLKSIGDLIYGEIFSDFLEMSSYLLDEGYKDPAAVIAGGTLEEHLRKLCNNYNIPIIITTQKGPKPKKAEQMNSDLVGKNVYSKLDQKNVTAWLDLRNKAAHAKYSEYTKEQVSTMIMGIREFISRIS